MPLVYLRPAAARELAALVTSIDPPRTPGDVVLAAVRSCAHSPVLAAHLASIEPPQPPRGTGRRARRAAAKGAP